MEDPIEETAAVVMLDVVRIHGENPTLTEEQLRSVIVEALKLHTMELPYATVPRRAASDAAPQLNG